MNTERIEKVKELLAQAEKLMMTLANEHGKKDLAKAAVRAEGRIRDAIQAVREYEVL